MIVTTHNKKFGFYFINCEFTIEFDNDFTTNIKTQYFYNTDIICINRFLLYELYYFILSGHNFSNVNQMTITTISDKCNMTYEHYLQQPMHMCKRKINMNIAENPELINLLDRNKNYPLIRIYSHIPFNN